MKLVPLLTTIFITFCCGAFSQEYSYTHYDISDGLAGSTVYCITQDKDGFIWTGTETGVSRFDGTHFHDYTTVDGLPDVEILEMYGDSKGRVWMSPFTKGICYYYKGKIFNQANDSLLRKVSLKDNIMRFAEDSFGNILIQEKTQLTLISANGRLVVYDSILGAPIRYCGAICRSSDGHFLVEADNEVYAFSDKGFSHLFTIHMESPEHYFIAMNSNGVIYRNTLLQQTLRNMTTGKTVTMPFERIHYRHISYTSVGDSLIYFNESEGATEYNMRTGGTRRFLPGREVSRTFRDATGNTWFTTLGQGIYRLNSDEFRTLRLKVPGSEISSITAISRIGDELFVGDNHNFIFRFALPALTPLPGGTINAISKNSVLGFRQLPNGHFLVFSDNGVDEIPATRYWKEFHADRDWNRNIPRLRFAYPSLKNSFEKSPDEQLIGAFWGVGTLDLHSFLLKDTIWSQRATTIYYRKDTTFIGTLNGLYAIAKDRSATYLGDTIPFFRKRISAIAESADGTLWVASYDTGLVGYKAGRITTSYSRQSGLSSDICRNLLIQGSNCWIGTDRGLNRIRLDQPGSPILQYTSQDGLGSDIINLAYADGPVVYVGTPAGLSYFDETKVDLSEGCRLHLLSIQNGGKERLGDSASLSLPYTDKHIRFEYAGISYRSVGGIAYRYRLIGLDTTWRTTKETFLEYQALPSGNYELQLLAINKFGVHSAMKTVPFTVHAPFWQMPWFIAVIFLTFMAMVWIFVSLRISNIRRRQTEKEHLNRRVTEMEHMALQAQMNPHFIFNCMNSIQQYIFDQDIFAANKYIAGFSRLIRATLQNSTRPFITLPEEIDYLSGYLSLEKLRFKEKIDYSIEVDNSIDDPKFVLPPMLIQPYVENSMRHGLRHKVHGKGHIWLKFRTSGSRLFITVEDNGIGRKKAGTFKTSEHIEYQSKGMSLTAERIRMINSKYNDPIVIDVIDLEDEFGAPQGTRVVMELPFFHIILEKEAT